MDMPKPSRAAQMTAAALNHPGAVVTSRARAETYAITKSARAKRTGCATVPPACGDD